MTLTVETPELFTKTYNPLTCEVTVTTRLTLHDYERVTPWRIWEKLKDYARLMQGKKLIFVGATAAGGGVAIMRMTLIPLLRMLGVDARWYVLKPNMAAFKVTKGKFHNVLQNVAGPGVELTAADRSVYELWIKECAVSLAQPLSEVDVIVIDDWQPSLLIPYIKGDERHAGFNPGAKILFRDHIQTEGALMGTPGTPQHTTWHYIWGHNRVSDADLFIVHPKDEFVPPDVPDHKVVFMPATCDLLDDLNRPLSEAETREGIAFINGQLAINEGQKPIDSTRPYIVLIARFDPSKGMPQGMASYALARQMLVDLGVPLSRIPQLVVVGNGSIDDPEGLPVLAEIMRLRREVYADIMDDIKVGRVPHNDMAINALIGGALLALQPSTKEGFESRVTDAILQSVPVLGSNQGGIPLQIFEGQSGHILDPYDIKQWAARIVEFVTDVNKRAYMREQTGLLAKSHNYQFTTIPNAVNWLYLAHTALINSAFEGNRRWAFELAMV
jgi:glycosyltransferase involved in cell wall biosynthesis